MKRTIYSLISAFICLLFTGSTPPRNPKWLVYYGPSLSATNLKDVDVAILEPDHIDPRPLKKNTKTLFFGYVSVGEAERYRDYWKLVQGKSFLLPENKDWPGAHYVDVRSKDWHRIILDHVIPRIVEKGYDGVFLDTIDTAIYLESDFPNKKYAGARKAMVSLVKKIKARYPKLHVLPNNGLEFLDDYGKDVYGVVVEDLYTRYNFASKKNQRTPLEDTQYKEKYLDRFMNRFHKPVFNILYEKSPVTDLARYGIENSKKKGYGWYLTTVDLQKLGTLSH